MNFSSWSAFWADFQTKLGALIVAYLNPVINKLNEVTGRTVTLEGYFTDGKATTAVNAEKFEGKTYAEAYADIIAGADAQLRAGASPTETLETLRTDITTLNTSLATTNGNVSTNSGNIANLQATVDTFLGDNNNLDLDTMAELVAAIEALQASDQNIMGQYVKLSDAGTQVIDSNISIGVNQTDTLTLVASGSDFSDYSTSNPDFYENGQTYSFVDPNGSTVSYTVNEVRNGNVSFVGNVTAATLDYSNSSVKDFSVSGEITSNNGTHKLSDKANQTDVDTAVAGANAAAASAASDAATAQTTADAAQATADTKVSQTDYDARVTSVNGSLASKVDQTAHDARVTAVDNALGTKADQTTVDASVTNLQDQIDALGAADGGFVSQTDYDTNKVATDAAINDRVRYDELSSDLADVYTYIDAQIAAISNQ